MTTLRSESYKTNGFEFQHEAESIAFDTECVTSGSSSGEGIQGSRGLMVPASEFYIGQSSHQTHSTVEASKTNMLRGTLFLLGSCLSYTAWFIVQVGKGGELSLHETTIMLVLSWHTRGLIISKGHSRIPVYSEKQTNIVALEGDGDDYGGTTIAQEDTSNDFEALGNLQFCNPYVYPK
ncbi:hypothetical protein JHK82_044955 [Glycine max]|nr:hypothetical protein JHK82_044955 [Glycine max]